MNVTRFTKIRGLVVASAALLSAISPIAADTLPVNAAALFGNIGGSFAFSPADTSGLRFNVTADTVGQGSVLGNFTDHAELVVQFPAAGSTQPITLTGSGTWTTSDGKSSVTLSVTGTATPDLANPFIFNNNYQATITGGTGAFAGATGRATVSEVVQFNSTLSGGCAALTFKGYVLPPPAGQ